MPTAVRGLDDAALVLRITAYTGRDDQDSVFLDAFDDEDFSPLNTLPRSMLLSAHVGYTARTSHAVYETVVPFANSAARHLGCGAKPPGVLQGDIAPADPGKGQRTVPVTEAGGTACGWVARARLPRAADRRVEPLMNDTAPAGRCDLVGGAAPSSTYLNFAAWYGGWSNRPVSSGGVRRGLTATARCDGEAASFAVSGSQRIPGVGTAEKRRLLRAFAADQAGRRGCANLRLTGRARPRRPHRNP
ncbi:hypothetical protein AQI95_14405 [Streptomyces yokosukanensis]|uniref:Uncharacterized protein n=1 Tax=Streptomyces yokosukanensis TaxID=67386 RepID=A0A101P731_9ACTN|nr:hypothetical protein AQI95_14405 [Streptomyces yokosukanensis]